MSITIIDESADRLEDYGTVPIAFEASSRFVVSGSESGGYLLVEQTAEPFIKDYDAFDPERPLNWPKRFDVSNWAFFAAYFGSERAGGAVVAWNTPGVEMLEERGDLACLWDIRVHPEHRGSGVGRDLFDAAVRWARERGCMRLKIETQNINIPACRFYAARGCVLREANHNVYPGLDEIQLIWQLDL